MPRSLTVEQQAWPIAGSFRISRGAKTEANVVVVEIAEGDQRGRGRGDARVGSSGPGPRAHRVV